MSTSMKQECTNNELSLPSSNNNSLEVDSCEGSRAMAVQTDFNELATTPESRSSELLRQLRMPLSELKTAVYQLVNTPNLSQQNLGEHLGRIRRQVDIADRAVESLTAWAQDSEVETGRSLSGSRQASETPSERNS